MSRKFKKPNFLLYYLAFWLVYPYLKLKNRVKINRHIKKVKGPVIIISNHPSRPDFVYSVASVYPLRVNVVVARYYTYLPKINWLLNKLQAIPKNLFNPDSSTIKAMLSVIKNNGSVLLMPEGRLSSDGTKGIMPEGIEKLIKKVKVPVLTVNIKGGYLTGGKWIESRRKGRVQVDLDLLLTQEEIGELSECEIKKRIDDALEYNDFDWIIKEDLTFKGKSLTKGLENLLYLCPECHSEFTLVAHRHSFQCEKCKFTVQLNKQYQFISDGLNYPINNIKEWFSYQKEYVRNLYRNGEFNLSTEVILKTPVNKKNKLVLNEVGRGKCLLTKEGLFYHGTNNQQSSELFFPIQVMPTLLFGCNEDFEIYHDNQFYYFEPVTNRLQTVKWSIYTEVAYELLRELQNIAS